MIITKITMTIMIKIAIKMIISTTTATTTTTSAKTTANIIIIIAIILRVMSLEHDYKDEITHNNANIKMITLINLIFWAVPFYVTLFIASRVFLFSALQSRLFLHSILPFTL